MAVIRELSSHVADLIAAGEVVERPASVVKELVENALDAGAENITLEIQNGGITYIRITDDGKGMAQDDAKIAFKRHATSKIWEEQDLQAIGTLGFRGEALAAISAVSRIDLFTKEKGKIEGTHVKVEGGIIQEIEEAGCPEGTTFIIRDLFYNTPARMKFLRKDFTEAGYVLGVVQKAAMSYPSVRFTCIKDGKKVFSTPGDGKLFSALYNVFGKKLAADLLKAAPYEKDGIQVSGYISKPYCARANRSMQVFFVNGRYIKSGLIQAAMEESYRNRMITGKYPLGTLNIQLPFSWVDVNVHPAKTEVKFSQEKKVFEAVYICCKNALEQDANRPEIRAKEDKKLPKEDNLIPFQEKITVTTPEEKKEKTFSPVDRTFLSSEGISTGGAAGILKQASHGESNSEKGIYIERVDWQPPEPNKPTWKPYIEVDEQVPEKNQENVSYPKDPVREIEKTERTANITESVKREQPLIPNTRVVGECFHTYILVEEEDGLILIDKHAAHERILFNQLRKTTDIPIQVLLSPEVVNLSREEAAVLAEGLEEIRKIGFEIEPFGENSFIVRQIPSYIEAGDVAATLSEMAFKLQNRRSATPDRLDDLIHTVSCKAAIKGGSTTSSYELQNLCDRVLSDPEVTSCPHGRPVTVHLTKYEIDKMFKRVNQ